MEDLTKQLHDLAALVDQLPAKLADADAVIEQTESALRAMNLGFGATCSDDRDAYKASVACTLLYDCTRDGGRLVVEWKTRETNGDELLSKIYPAMRIRMAPLTTDLVSLINDVMRALLAGMTPPPTKPRKSRGNLKMVHEVKSSEPEARAGKAVK